MDIWVGSIFLFSLFFTAVNILLFMDKLFGHIFQLSWVYIESVTVGSCDNAVQLFEELLNCFPQWLCQFTFQPAMPEVPVSSHPH